MPIGSILSSFSEEEHDPDMIPFADKQKVKLCGIVTSKTVKTTRNGASMAFITLEDKTGEIELVVFPKILENCAHILMKDTAVCLRGEISAEEDKAPKILVSAVNLIADGLPEEAPARRSYPVRQSTPHYEKKASSVQAPKPEAPAAQPQKPAKLYLKVPDKNGEIFSKVMSLLSIFEGSTPVIIYNEKEKKYEKYSVGADIRPNMLAYLKTLLGESSVVLK